MTNFLPPDTPSVCYAEAALAPLAARPCHFRCGVYMACVQGRATVSTGVQLYEAREQTELIFLTGGLFQVLKASPDCRVRVLLFPKDVFLKAMLPIDTPYFNYAHEHPYYQHTPDGRSQKTWGELLLWMDMAQMLFAQPGGPFRALQEQDYLQSLLIWLFGTIPEKLETGNAYGRKQVLCHRFIQLVREHGTRERQVPFYAGELCISPRYLHQVTARCLGGKTPKQVIDEQLLAEAKVLLGEPALSVTEVAAQLNFADQSHLCRFFKKSTGLSPREFRRQRLL